MPYERRVSETQLKVINNEASNCYQNNYGSKVKKPILCFIAHAQGARWLLHKDTLLSKLQAANLQMICIVDFLLTKHRL